MRRRLRASPVLCDRCKVRNCPRRVGYQEKAFFAQAAGDVTLPCPDFEEQFNHWVEGVAA